MSNVNGKKEKLTISISPKFFEMGIRGDYVFPSERIVQQSRGSSKG